MQLIKNTQTKLAHASASNVILLFQKFKITFTGRLYLKYDRLTT